MGKKDKPTGKAKRKGGSTGKLSLFLFATVGVLTFLIEYSLILVLAGMLPTIIAYITDRSPNRFIYKTVGCMNFAGIAPYVSLLMQQGNKEGMVRVMLSDPSTWIVMYGSAAMGWAIVWLAPLMVKHILMVFAGSRKEALLAQQEEIKEEWGEDIQYGRQAKAS